MAQQPLATPSAIQHLSPIAEEWAPKVLMVTVEIERFRFLVQLLGLRI